MGQSAGRIRLAAGLGICLGGKCVWCSDIGCLPRPLFDRQIGRDVFTHGKKLGRCGPAFFVVESSQNWGFGRVFWEIF